LVVLLTGANGFIGRHLADALLRAGHQVVCAVRDPSQYSDPRFHYIATDFTRDTSAADWLPRLAAIDIVINAAGIVREHDDQTFDAIHTRGPCALFAACAQSAVRLVIQISALGADRHAISRFHLSKKAADDFLAALPVAAAIVQPSLVYGPGGTSARLFTTLASLPLIGLPGDGMQMIQPVHLDDAIAAIVTVAGRKTTGAVRVPLVGPAPLPLKAFLSSLRHAMGLGAARFLPMPMPLVRFAAQIGRVVPHSLLEPETLQMLERGNTADAAAIADLLGRAPRGPEHFIAPLERPAVRLLARLNWLLPVLRWSIALVWIATGIVSLGLYPVADSYALLARVGISGALAPLMLYGAALLDLVFGIATLVLRRRRRLWLAQIAVILLYSAIISIKLPEFWLHPYGPLLKNLPMLAALWLLLELEKEPEG
jgi:nucleoside-diphosphate-sugar epimerase